MDKITLSMEDLQDYKTDHGIVILPYIGYSQCYECALKMVQGDLTAEPDYIYKTPHGRVNRLFYLVAFCTNLNTLPLDSDEGRIALHDYLVQEDACNETYKNSVLGALKNSLSYEVILGLVDRMESAFFGRTEPVRVLARVLSQVISPISKNDADSIDQVKMLSEQLLELLGNKKAPDIEKPQATMINFAKRTN